ncbi:hypothetical protein [Ruania alba]|uniref:Zinc-finger n=1 Tax=Ruania alba TaxID=648782 RepID=A0A1H5KA34_9MICO|nr:hypothetical protein [Ruania alba]SED49326.1 hypothetical protein SAMN04488554_0006 [Ruania alba]SEE60881.1 hypothetical protein SAMN04488554_2133 [Ruania alba]
MTSSRNAEWHPDEDALIEVALDHADADTRIRVSDHLAACSACRHDYDERAGAIEQVLPAVPRHAPGPDFESDVLARLRAERTGEPGRGAPRTRASGRRRAIFAVAAAWLLGLALGAGAVALLDGGTEAPPSAAAEWSAPLLTADGTRIGQVSRGWGPDGPMLVVDVAEGPVGVEYTCLVEYADGTKADLGAWALSADSPNRWIVADDGVTSVDLVAESGQVWSSAEL